MDIDYFLKKRTKFIRYFYENSMSSFEKTKKSIDDEDEPYKPTIYQDDGEPEYLEEWIEADMGLNAVSHTCISMLSSSLHLFMKSWFDRLIQNHGMKFEFDFKNNGWFNEYKRVLIDLEFPLYECESNLGILEQVVLARNRVQHPEEISDLRISHSKHDMKKYPNPFFVQENEVTMATEEEGNLFFWFPPTITATKEKIEEAISNVEIFASWLESEYWKAKNA